MANGDISKLGLRGASVNARFWCSARTQFAGAFLRSENGEDGQIPSGGRTWHPTPLHKTQRAGDPGRGTLSLTAVFGDDSDLHAEGAQDRIDGFKAWVCAGTQGFV